MKKKCLAVLAVIALVIMAGTVLYKKTVYEIGHMEFGMLDSQ